MFWGKSRNIVIALEVGSTKVAAAVGEIRPDGTLALLGIGEGPSGQVRKCEIIDFEVAQGCVREALAAAEQKTDVVIAEVYLTISGAHMRSSNIRLSTAVNHDGDENHARRCAGNSRHGRRAAAAKRPCHRPSLASVLRSR